MGESEMPRIGSVYYVPEGTKRTPHSGGFSCERSAMYRLGSRGVWVLGLWMSVTGCDDGTSSGEDTDPQSGGTTSGDGTPPSTTSTAPSTSSTSSATSGSDGGTSSGGSTSDSSTSEGVAESSSSGEPVVCEPPQSLSVLFIGNSFTFTHDLPGMVSGLGEDASLPIETDSLTEPGQRLSYHVQNEATRPMIQSRSWDYVVIQGHSLETLNQLDAFLADGQTLVEWIEDAGAEPLLYETWARSPLHDIYTDPGFGYADPDEMQDAIRDGYQMLSNLTGARVVPAGDAWQALWSTKAVDTHYPWGGDEYHPSVVGTYLNASVFFVAMTGVSLDTVTGEQPVGEKAAAALHDFAEQVAPPCR